MKTYITKSGRHKFASAFFIFLLLSSCKSFSLKNKEEITEKLISEDTILFTSINSIENRSIVDKVFTSLKINKKDSDNILDKTKHIYISFNINKKSDIYFSGLLEGNYSKFLINIGFTFSKDWKKKDNYWVNLNNNLKLYVPNSKNIFLSLSDTDFSFLKSNNSKQSLLEEEKNNLYNSSIFMLYPKLSEIKNPVFPEELSKIPLKRAYISITNGIDDNKNIRSNFIFNNEKDAKVHTPVFKLSLLGFIKKIKNINQKEIINKIEILLENNQIKIQKISFTNKNFNIISDLFLQKLKFNDMFLIPNENE